MEIKHIPLDGKDITKDDIKRIIKEKDVKIIRLQFVDMNGHIKNLAIPSQHIDKALNNEMMLDGSSIKGFRSIETSRKKNRFNFGPTWSKVAGGRKSGARGKG